MNKYIYRYTDPSRNEVIYIGQGTKSKNEFARSRVHVKRKDKHPFTQRLQKMAREGVQPVIEILIEGIDKELADLIETEAIDKYGRKDLGKGPLLNLTDGGDGGKHLGPETSAKKSASIKKALSTPESRAARSKAQKESCARPEVKHNRSEAQKRAQKDVHHKSRGPVTIDGITIFGCRDDLISALGYGSAGLRHPNFRYVEKESTNV